jgi:hypothetical protein
VTNPIPEEIKDFISYNPETGECVWKKINSNRVKNGDTAGSQHTNGYREVSFKNRKYLLHRVIWFIHYGEQPGDKQIDHMNGNRSDNRISNLRLVTQLDNLLNKKVLGIYHDKRDGKWYARIRVDGVTKSLGSSPCPLLAGLAYQDAKKQLHPTAVRGLS